MAQDMMTYEQQEVERLERLNEVGTMPPCPFCGRARVQRSDYVRCNPCGKNWLNGEDLSLDPRLTRRTLGIPLSGTGTGSIVPPVKLTTEHKAAGGERGDE
jgi:hypothetical protein